MKKVVVMSDNHGVDKMMEYIKNKEPDADYYIHCGDSEAMQQNLLTGYICVRGNNDWGLDLPQQAKLKVEDFRILITHGQYFGFFNRQESMRSLLEKEKCQVLLSGHTHMPMCEHEDGFYFINPGSTSLPRGGSLPSYAVLLIDGKKISCQIKEL